MTRVERLELVLAAARRFLATPSDPRVGKAWTELLLDRLNDLDVAVGEVDGEEDHKHGYEPWDVLAYMQEGTKPTCIECGEVAP